MEANAIRSVAPHTREAAKAGTGDLVRVIAASTAGSAMEWYDFRTDVGGRIRMHRHSDELP
jgi:hypothetical protein